MKPGTKIVLACAFVIAVASLSSVKRGWPLGSAGRSRGVCCPFLSTPVPAATNAPDQQVIAYYFHGTIRCETCLRIEKQAKETIERQFRAELGAKWLVFKSVNYQKPENRHFLQDYQLPCPSLVLVRRKNGGDEKWTLLGKTWELVENRAKFDEYIETQVHQLLSGRKRPEAGNSNVPLP